MLSSSNSLSFLTGFCQCLYYFFCAGLMIFNVCSVNITICCHWNAWILSFVVVSNLMFAQLLYEASGQYVCVYLVKVLYVCDVSLLSVSHKYVIFLAGLV